MDRSRFEAIVAAYGAEPERWPAAERAAAAAFAQAHPEVAGPLLARERALDRLLDAARQDVPAGLAGRMMAHAARPAGPRLPDWAGMAAAVALVAGLGLGWAGSALTGGQDAAEEALYMAAFDSLDEDSAWILEGAR